MKVLRRPLAGLAAILLLASPALAQSQNTGSSNAAGAPASGNNAGGGGGAAGGQGGGSGDEAGQGGGQAAGGPAGGGGGQQMPPPAVSVVTVKPRTIPVTYEYAGRVAASREVEVRARVAGILLERTFEEGARVAQNQVLFRIDPREFEAQVKQAEAQVQQFQAQLTNAQRTAERARALAQSGATSTASLEDAVAQQRLVEAQLAGAQAALYTANLSLTYATVNAPVGGITSLEQVPEGSLLSVNTLLTRISQLDPVYVNFSAADTEAIAIRRLIESGVAYGAPNGLSVEVAFGDGSEYDQKGTIDFTSSSIDTSTGTILSRAVLPNPRQRLLPGQFVRVKIEGLTLDNAIEIPSTALMQNPQGQYVFTVGPDNVAKVQPIKVGREGNQTLIVADGLKEGDRVVTEGVIKVRPNTPVNPTEAQPQQTDAPPGPGGQEVPGAGGTAPSAGGTAPGMGGSGGAATGGGEGAAAGSSNATGQGGQANGGQTGSGEGAGQ